MILSEIIFVGSALSISLTYCFVKSCKQVEHSRCSQIELCCGCFRCSRLPFDGEDVNDVIEPTINMSQPQPPQLSQPPQLQQPPQPPILKKNDHAETIAREKPIPFDKVEKTFQEVV
jgi:hypothetical protein